MAYTISSDLYAKPSLQNCDIPYQINNQQPDTETLRLLEKINSADQPPLNEVLLKTLQNTPVDRPKIKHVQISKIEDMEISGPNGPIKIRLYSPYSDKQLPVFIFFHGGGWALGNLDEYDYFCQEICRLSSSIVVSVDYHLAPQYKFPKPLEDCYTATEWVFTNIGRFGGDNQRLAIGGDSAGGNLASAVTLMNRDKKEASFKINYQILIFPALDNQFNTPSYEKFAEGYYLTRETMQFFWNNYLDKEQDSQSSYASPLKASRLSNLPPALVVLANFDPLFSEGLAYASRLKQDDVSTEIKCYNTIHGFINFEEDLKVAHEAIGFIAGSLIKNLNFCK